MNGKGEKNIKAGVIGCGGIANQKRLPALKNQSHRAGIAAFCGLMPQRAKKAAADYHDLVVRAEQAFSVTKILDAVYQSAKTGRQVVFE